MRIRGIMKVMAALVVDFVLCYIGTGAVLAAIVTGGIFFYAWIGESIAVFRDRAVSLEHLNDYERLRLVRVKDSLTEDVRRVFGEDISNLKLYVTASDQMNAYAYGFQSVAVTRAVLNSCDDATVCAVLGHEVSHILNMDAVFHRIIFANVMLILGGLIAGSFICMSVIWILFLILCLFGVCTGIFSMLIFHGVRKIVKGTFTAVQYCVVFLYQAVMGLISRRGEFRADWCSCQLGYRSQLRYFLTRFVEGQEPERQSLHEILYATHPPVRKRLQRIEQYRSVPVHTGRE